jgi:RNA recognition motif-containing protein
MNIEEESNDKGVKLFVGNVPFKCDLDEFKQVFDKEDGFLKAELIYRVKSKLTRGFGFVEFTSLEDVEKVLNNKYTIDDRVLRITQYSNEKKDLTKTNTFKLFVRNLDDVDELTLRSAFEKYGAVKNCYVMKDRENGNNRGFGVVEYNNKDHFFKALNEKEVTVKDDVVVNVYPYRVKYNKAKPLVKKRFVDNKSTYRQGFNNGHAAGYSEGYYVGYESGYEDKSNGLSKDPKKNYLKIPHLQNLVKTE